MIAELWGIATICASAQAVLGCHTAAIRQVCCKDNWLKVSSHHAASHFGKGHVPSTNAGQKSSSEFTQCRFVEAHCGKIVRHTWHASRLLVSCYGCVRGGRGPPSCHGPVASTAQQQKGKALALTEPDNFRSYADWHAALTLKLGLGGGRADLNRVPAASTASPSCQQLLPWLHLHSTSRPHA